MYLLKDSEHLYMGGIVFSGDETVCLWADIGDNTVAVVPSKGECRVNDGVVEPVQFVCGRHPAGKVIDTRMLNLTTTHKRTGKAEHQSETEGKTFELALSWKALGFDGAPSELPGRFRLLKKSGEVLQQPLAVEDEPEWLVLKM